MELVFWFSFIGTVYAYFLYPVLLLILAHAQARPASSTGPHSRFSAAVIIPVHNESGVIGSKLDNLRQTDYPAELLDVIIVSDGSTDETASIVRSKAGELKLQYIELADRQGKANALNEGLSAAVSDIIIFTDASILLERDAISKILLPFNDEAIGCVSGEDHIMDRGGESLYGKYELFLRNKESLSGSIVGASGSFYAQRRMLCKPFPKGWAPDFFSVLNTVEQGYRAITEPRAQGVMYSVKSPQEEFQRKVRTLLRGMTALFGMADLLNPFRFGRFSLFLVSHKLIRWLVPVFLLGMLVSCIFLFDSIFYKSLLALQAVFYALALAAYPDSSPLHNRTIGKVPLFFSMANLAIIIAWVRYFRGERQELWSPSKRDVIDASD